MDVRSAIDQGRFVDWSRVSADYARYRPDPPPALDAEHDAVLRRIAPESFTVRHRLDAQFFELE